MKYLLIKYMSPTNENQGDVNISTLLDKIQALETKLDALEKSNAELSKQNEQIKGFNRQLLDRQASSTPIPNPSSDAQKQLDNYLKGD